MTALVTKHLPLVAGAPDGIKKLRELILDLAVCGMLVPQEQKLAVEQKHAPIKIGRETIKRVGSRDVESKPFPTPSDWEWAKLGDIAVIERGGSPRPIKAFLTTESDGLNWIKIGDTERGGKYITSASEKIRPEGLSKTRVVYPGDFLLTNSMSFGRPYITQIEGCIHDGWLRIVPPSSLDRDYLYSLLSSPYVRRFFVHAAAGAVVMNLNADKVRELPVPVPPLAEQLRIVAKVDALMALCDRLEADQADAEGAHARLVQALLDSLTQATDAADFRASWQRLSEHFHTLFTTEASIDALKQTVLQLAVTGKLVPNEANCDEWHWTTLGSLITDMDAGWSPACEEQPSPSPEIWGVLRTTAVQRLEYVEKENKQLPAHLDPRPTAEVKQGDVLFTRAGPMNRVGISCLVESTRPRLMLSDKIIRFRPKSNALDGRFTVLCLNAGVTAKYLEEAKSGMAASQVNISQAKLKAAPIPAPPLSEQLRIVAKVDEMIALCDRLKAQLAEARQQHAQLAKALVEQAVA